MSVLIEAMHAPEFSGASGALSPRVWLEKYPYPYSAMLAICSDLDETPDRDTYLDIAKFLNTTGTSTMGCGVGLEVGNTIYFDMPPNQFSYRGTDDAGREMVQTLIKSGHIDCLHSYGDCATTRVHAERALEELDKHGCSIEVWVDHSKAPSNFGPDIMVGRGDVVDADVYHADLTLEYGIRYVWRGRTTSMAGQNAPIDGGVFARMIDRRHPVASGKAMVKEGVKVLLGARGDPKWEMYAANEVCRASVLRDGQPVWEFLRSNPHWGGPGAGADADGMSEVLTRRSLDAIVDREGVSIIYTHLGKVSDARRPFNEATVGAFRLLARYQADLKILVTTTRRLLRYITTRDCLAYTARVEGDCLRVTVHEVADAVFGVRPASMEDVEGLVFASYWDGPIEVRFSDGASIPVAAHRWGGVSHAAVPWRRLTFPDF